MPTELKRVIADYLDLLRSGSVDEPSALAHLERLLDALAYERHEVVMVASEPTLEEPPEWPYEQRRALASRRFPSLGLYATPLDRLESGGADLGVGDAIDDVAEIAGELAGVAWLWEQAGEAAALAHYRWTFAAHWGAHLRGLQLYLHVLKGG